MMNLKPVYLKTYGKQTRKLSAWISPINRKQAFDSTLSTDGDISVFEPSKPTKREKKASVCKRRVARLAKKKAMLCLTEKSFDEDNIPYPRCPPPDQQMKIIRETDASGSRDKAVRPPKRKPVLHLLKTSSDEENICRPCDAQPCQQSRKARKSRLVSAPRVFMKGQKFPVTSESEEDSTSNAIDLTHSGHMKRNSNVPLPSAGRFVTRRRRAAAKPKLPKERSCNLNSSEDFTSGTSSSRRILRPSRRIRVPPTFLTSGAENSANAAVTSSSTANPFQEMSLNELADYSLRLRPKKPMFCSTPSADPVCKRPCLTPLSITDRSATSPSMSVSCISVSSTFQAVLVSPEQPVSLKPTGLSTEEKLQMSFGEQEPSGDIFMDAMNSNKRSSFSKEAESHAENLCTDDSESISHFMSSAGGLEWLTEILKENCLTERCSVQLERLNYYSNTVSQLPNQSICNLNSLAVGQSTSYSLSIDSEPMEQSAPALVECTHQTEGSVEFITDTELLAKSRIHTLFTAEEAAAVKDKSLTQKCTVQLQKLDLSQLKGDRLTRNEKSANSNAKESENNGTDVIDEPEGATCSGGVTERMSFLVPQPISNSRPVYLTRLDGPEAEEKAAVTTMTLMEKCLTDKFQVKVEKLPVSELKKILLLRNSKPTYVSDSDRADQTESHQQSETDTNHWNEDIPAMRVNMNKRSSTSSRDKIPSEKQEVVKDARNIPHKRKKTSLTLKGNKRRSTSTDRTGTIRKACVSGLSVNRWRNKNQTSTYTSSHRAAGGGCYKTGDCSISELIPSQNKQPWVRTTCTQELLGTTMNFSTPVKASRLNLSSLLTELTPNTHTWSRLKAALSVHRKVLLTPKNSNPWGSPGRSNFADVSQDLFATPFRSSLPKRLRSQLQDSVIECENLDLSDAEKVYAECGQQCPLPWEECIIPQYMKQCVKIGEGTFGEVFSFTNVSGDTVALKIIPVEGSKQVNGEDQKAFGEILHEIIISKELSSLKEKQQNQTLGFIGLNNLHCVQGYYPPDFLNAWDDFDQKKGSENDRPDFFEKDQIFLILEFEFGGIDLENSNGMLMSLGVAKSILHQVTAALAVAEQCLNFEHRDLHWGNVLVKKTKAKKGSFLLNGAAHSFETKGVLVRIIDYSLSRLEIDDLTVSCDISNDEELFMGQGDYQFDIYRLMRQENGNNWSNYHPHTNILWLHYLCSKLLSMKYRGAGGRAAKDMREALTRFYDNVLEYSSATEALHKCPVFQ